MSEGRNSNVTEELARVQAAARRPPAEAVELLVPLLRSKQPAVIQEAAAALGATEQRAAIPPLMEAYARADEDGPKRDRGCRIRRAIVEALAKLDARTAVPLVRRAIRTVQVMAGTDTALDLRAAAAAALAQLEPQNAIHDLALLLFDREPNCPVPATEYLYAKAQTRIVAAKAIAYTSEPAGAALLAVKLVFREMELPDVLSACLEGIAALHPPNLKEVVRPYLEGRDPILATTAATSLASSLGEEALPILVESYQRAPREARVPFVLAITSVRSARTGPALLSFLADPSPEVRLAAVEGASLYMDEAVRERLERVAKGDPDRRVCMAAARALAGRR